MKFFSYKRSNPLAKYCSQLRITSTRPLEFTFQRAFFIISASTRTGRKKKLALKNVNIVYALKAVVLNDRIESIGANTFSGCGNLPIINISATITDIADNAFVDCPNLRIYCTTVAAGERYAIEANIPYEVMDAN